MNQLLREERDATVRATKEVVSKLQGVSLRCEANRRRLELLRHKLDRPSR